jgi:hypothetical protein
MNTVAVSSRFAGQFGGLAKVDSGLDYASDFFSFACDRLVALDGLQRRPRVELSRKAPPRSHDRSSSASANPP